MIETHLRVRYAETDAMGIVHHASYIVWLELGRTELLRSRGMSYREIEAHGYFVVLSELQVRYLAPARYDDPITVRTELAEVRSRQLSFTYHVRHAEETTPVLTARTDHIIVARSTGRPTRIPSFLLDLLRPS